MSIIKSEIIFKNWSLQMGCSNSKLASEIVQIKQQLYEQTLEQNTLQVEVTYLIHELKTLHTQFNEFKDQFQEL